MVKNSSLDLVIKFQVYKIDLLKLQGFAFVILLMVLMFLVMKMRSTSQYNKYRYQKIKTK